MDIPYTALAQFLVDQAKIVLPTSLVAEEMGHYEKRLDEIYDGKGVGAEYADYGDLYWFTEDCSFFRFTANKDRFFRELEDLIGKFLKDRETTIEPELLSEVVRYQWLRMPSADLPPVQQWQFRHNIPEFMEHVVTNNPVAIGNESQVIFVDPIDYKGNLNRFALERAVYGRKNDDILWPVTWFTSDQAPFKGPNDDHYIPPGNNREGLGVW